MGFGSNYYPVESAPQLECGDYTVRIKKVEMKNYPSGDEYCDITVDVKDHPGAKPDHIILNSAPVEGQIKNNGQPVTKEDVDRGNAKITRFFKSFGIQDGNFIINQWVGKVGTVHCDWQYDSKEADKKSKQYKQLFPKVGEKTEAPKAEAVKPSAQPAAATVQNGEFPEDIPF